MVLHTARRIRFIARFNVLLFGFLKIAEKITLGKIKQVEKSEITCLLTAHAMRCEHC